MGDLGTSIFGSGGKQTTDNTIDPESQAANTIRVGQLQGVFGQQNLGQYAQPRPDVYTGTPAIDALFQGANTAPSPYSVSNSYQAPGAVAPNDYSNLMSLADYQKQGLDQGQNYISQVAKPEIMQAAALQGLEGGGFVADAIARATAGIALPFLQTLPGASSQLTLAQPQAESLRANTSGTYGNLALTGPQGNLVNAQTALTGPQGNLINAQQNVLGAQKATELLPLADYNRALSQQDLLRQQGLVTTAFTGIPFTPVQDSVAKKSSQPLFNFFGQG